MPTIMYGKPVAEEVLLEVKKEVETLQKRGISPKLAVVLVGNDPASRTYVSSKEKKAKEAGIETQEFHLPEKAPEAELLARIQKLNQDHSVHGILVQFPLPKHISEHNVRAAILPGKDVDGLHFVNQGKLFQGEEGLVPCTPKGILRMLEFYGVKIEGKHVVVVGRSLLVGRPLAMLLMHRNATVTVCHSRTPNLEQYTRQADILCVAVGKPHLITGDMVKEGVVVVDVGINRVEEKESKDRVETRRKVEADPAAYANIKPELEEGEKKSKLAGDVDFESVSRKASFISPVPGGVGPMTIAMLLSNTVEAAKRQGKA